MAWVTPICDDEQVDYRLREDAGCYVQTGAEEQAPDDVVDYRMRPETDGILVWVGTGLEAVGLAAGRPLDEAAVPARPAVPAVAAHRQQPPLQGPRRSR